MSEKRGEIQGKWDLARVSGEFELSEFELSRFYCLHFGGGGRLLRGDVRTALIVMDCAFLTSSVKLLYPFNVTFVLDTGVNATQTVFWNITDSR